MLFLDIFFFSDWKIIFFIIQNYNKNKEILFFNFWFEVIILKKTPSYFLKFFSN